MNSSDVLRQGASSSTSFVATLAGAATVNYTPATPVMVTIVYSLSSGSITVNGIPILNFTTAASNGSISFFAGAGQALTITGNSGVQAIITAQKVN